MVIGPAPPTVPSLPLTDVQIALEESKFLQEVIGRQETMRFELRKICMLVLGGEIGLFQLPQFQASEYVLPLILSLTLGVFWLIEVMYYPPFGAAIDRQLDVEELLNGSGTSNAVPYGGPDFAKRLVDASNGRGTSPHSRKWAGIRDGRIYRFYLAVLFLLTVGFAMIMFDRLYYRKSAEPADPPAVEWAESQSSVELSKAISELNDGIEKTWPSDGRSPPKPDQSN